MVGRKDERARLKALLDAAREGRSGAVLLHGPPGIGKTELLRYAIEEAREFRLLRARGMESESDIPFAGLAELVTPLLAHLDEIPEVQATALRGALALGPATPLPRPEGSSPLRSDRFTVPAALLSLLEIPGLLSAAQLAGREPLEEPLRPGTNVERAFAAAVSALPDAARRALLVAAAASSRRLDALVRAGVALEALEPAEAARIIVLADGELEFRHPLLRSTVYHGASRDRAGAGGARGPRPRCARDRHARPDACRAAHAGDRATRRAAARRRGGRRPLRRGRARDRAAGRSVRADLRPAARRRRRAHARPRRDAPWLAGRRARAARARGRPRPHARSAAMFLEASVAHMMTGDVEAMIASAERVRALSAGAEPAVELLATAVIGEGQIALGEAGAGAALLRACEPYLMEADPLAMVEIVGMAAHAAIWIEDWDAASRILSRVLGAARAASAVSALIHPLAVQAHLDLRRGRWAPALAGASESAELADDTGQLALLPQALAALTLVEAALGHEADCRKHAARGLALADDVYLHAGLGLLELGLSRIPEAIEALETGHRRMLGRGISSTVVQLRPDLIEAYIRAGRREEAEAVLAKLEEDRSLWARAAAARCRALLAPDEAFRAAFDAALTLHDGLPMPFERARTLLALGERLRRAKQRAEEREPLNAALDAFERLGARPWAERARTELRATGGQASGRRAQAAAEQLTPHELQIAVLVAHGMTNREAAAALFLSPKTIEYHLGQIYRKLDVRGRAQLARLMAMKMPEGERDPAVLADALS